MKIQSKLLCGAILMALCVCSNGQDKLIISKSNLVESLIPVSVEGFSGEIDSVLKFDLEALGMTITSPDSAQYKIKGTQDGRLDGTLSPAGGRPLWARAYAGGAPRTQAHAFADDIVKQIRSTAPIFQTRIAFRAQEGASTEIGVSDFDGANAAILTHDGTLVTGPCWLPGGKGLLYTSWQNGGEPILQHNVSTGERQIFANYPGANLSPEVSPDGQKVAMILSRGGSPNLWVRNFDGSGLKQLTDSRDDDSSPTWSPDSQEICFVCRSGQAKLQKISAKGGAPRNLRVALVGGNMTSPDWSPDGKWIAFTSGSRNFMICVVPAEGGDAQKLVAGEDPCWAPNSRTLIFTKQVGNKRILSLLDVPTKHVKDVRQISGSCSQPSWAR